MIQQWIFIWLGRPIQLIVVGVSDWLLRLIGEKAIQHKGLLPDWVASGVA